MDAVLFNLGRMVGQEFDLDLIVGELPSGHRLADWFRVVQFPVRGFDPYGMRYAFKAVRRYLRVSSPKIIMSVGQTPSLGFAIAWYNGTFSGRTIVRMTGNHFARRELAQTMIEKLLAWARTDKMASFAYRRADLILTLGESLRGVLVKRGFDPAKIVGIPQPFDRRPFHPIPAEAKARRKEALGLDPSRHVILFVGRLSWLKGADRLLAVADRVRVHQADVQFCLVGTGEYVNEFARYPDEFVHLAGAVPHGQVASYYQAADKLVFPSRTEGLPNVILEAMAAGLPIVASSVGEIPHYVTHITEDVDECAQWLLDRSLVPDPLPEYFDWEHQREAYIELFHRALSKREGGSAYRGGPGV